MSLFRSSPESSHSSQPLSEAVFDSSSARDALPERHRIHFDELRSGIFAFCKQFHIPIETLKSKEAFGVELTSKRIPPERMAHAVSLFARLEHLVTHKELLKETLSEHLREIEQLYHLTEQYNTQVELLEQVGILKDGAITGIDGKNYPIPTLEQIASHLFEREKELSTKRDQGFTKLLLVPFGMSLDALREIFKQFLLDYKKDHSDFDLYTNDPFHIWKGYKGADTGDPPKIVYNPKSFDSNHQGQTKADILKAQADNPEDSFPGWKVHLLQPSNLQDLEDNFTLSKGFALIPRQSRGTTNGEKTSRPSLEEGKSPNEYLSTLQEAQEDLDSPYHSESGLTPEDWILAFMTHLTETGQPLDNYANGIESIACLTGAFFLSIDGSTHVPCAFWNREDYRTVLASGGLNSRGSYIGVRSSVVI